MDNNLLLIVHLVLQVQVLQDQAGWTFRQGRASRYPDLDRIVKAAVA